jgi:hypothetical protein
VDAVAGRQGVNKASSVSVRYSWQNSRSPSPGDIGRQPASWWRSRLITCRRGRLAPMGSNPLPSVSHFTRLAARSNTFLAHVETFGPAARFICANSASVSLSKNAGLRFSSSGNAGRPGPCLSVIKVYPNILAKPLTANNKRIY